MPKRFEWTTGEMVFKIQNDIKFIEKKFVQVMHDIKLTKKINQYKN